MTQTLRESTQQALDKICEQAQPESFSASLEDIVAAASNLDLLLAKVAALAKPGFVPPTLGSKVSKAARARAPPASCAPVAGDDAGRKKKKRGARKAAAPAVADEPACDKENLVQSATTGRPRRAKAASKAPKLPAVPKPMKTTTRSTRQTRNTRARKASMLRPPVKKSNDKKPARSSFKRQALQELVSNASNPNTPKSPGEGLRPKLSTEPALPGSENPVVLSAGTDIALDAAMGDEMSVSSSAAPEKRSTRQLKKNASEAIKEPGTRRTRSRKVQSPLVNKVDILDIASAEEETPILRKRHGKEAVIATDVCEDAASPIVEEKLTPISAPEQVVPEKNPSSVRDEADIEILAEDSASESPEDDDDNDADYHADDEDNMDVDSNGEEAPVEAGKPDAIASSPQAQGETKEKKKNRVSFADDKVVIKGTETETNKSDVVVSQAGDANDENAIDNAIPKSPATRFRVDESGNVTETALQDLMKIAEAAPPAKPKESESSSLKSAAVKKYSLFPQSSKRPPVLSSSRRTVSKTPGMKMPLDRSKQSVPSSQMYDDIANSLFPKSIFSAPTAVPQQSESKKKISFASHQAPEESNGGVSKKRGVESMDPSMSSPVIVKRPRSALSSTLRGKSALRERIESVRKRMSIKSAELAQTPAVQTPSNLTVNHVQTHFDLIKSPTSQAHGSSGVQFSKLQALEALDESERMSKKDSEDSRRKSSSTRITFGETTVTSLPERKSLSRTPACAEESKTPQSVWSLEGGPSSSKASQSPWSVGTDTHDKETPLKSQTTTPDVIAVHGSRRSPAAISVKSQSPSARRSVVVLSPQQSVQVVEIEDNTPRRPSMKEVPAAQDSKPDESIASSANNVVQEAAQSDGESAAPSALSNLMTSVKSFLPSTASLFGYTVEESEDEETEEMRAERIAKQTRLDMERREAEIIARREAFRLARQAEAEEKRKRVEAKRKALALAEQKREEERRRKEAERMRKLREDIDARKAKKAEEERKREQRRHRVLEHKRKVQAAEEARRAEVAAKEAQERRRAQQAAAARKGGAGPSSARGGDAEHMPPPPSKAPKTPGGQRALFGAKKKHSVEVTSYEMSAEKPNGDETSDEEDGRRHGKKKIPEWATKSNVLKALETQTEDPDKHFHRVHSVNLEEVFASTHTMKKRYRTRHSSGQWTRDRLTAREEMEYKKKAGYI